MRRWFPLGVFLASLSALPAETAQEIFARGSAALLAGDHSRAQQAFLQVLEIEPGNKAALANLQRIEVATLAQRKMKSQIEKVIVPKVDFRDAALTSVLDYLPKFAATHPSQAPLNIVRLFPKEYGDSKLITLQLVNVPLTDLLDYVAQLGGVTVQYEKAAVVVKLAAGGKTQ